MNFKFDGDRLFLTSDTHFNHTNILRYCNRPFKTVGQMNETIITNWNNVVGPDDEMTEQLPYIVMIATIKAQIRKVIQIDFLFAGSGGLSGVWCQFYIRKSVA